MKENFKEWFIKRNKRIAGSVAIGVFGLILIWPILNKSGKMSSLKFLESPANTRKNLIYNTNLCEVSSPDLCVVSCTGVDEDVLEEEIIKATKTCPVERNIKLVITSFKRTKVIRAYWLEKADFKIHFLRFFNSPIRFIHESAFNSSTFKNLKEVSLENTELEYLEIKTFQQFSRVQTLQIKFNEFNQNFFVEASLLDRFDFLEILQFHKCLTEKHLNNITGINSGRKLTSLQTFDIRYNNFNYLHGNSFKAAAYTRGLYLSENKIEYIHPDAFKGMTYLSYLNLEDNKLQNLENGTFEAIKYSEWNNGSIFLDRNDWVCNCSLKWLKDLYVQDKSPIYKFTVLMCNDGIPFREATFECSTDSSATEEIPSSTLENSNETEETTTVIPIKPETCENANDHTESPNYQKLFYQKNIKVREHPINISVMHFDDEIHTFIRVSRPIDEINLFWFNTFNQTESKCFSNLNGEIPMKEWKHEGVYTICLLDKGSSNVISPFSCAGVNVPEAWSNRSWIANKYKITTIALFSSAVAAGILLSGLGVFFLIRRYPNLLKGSKRIVMVGSRVTSAVVLPEEYDKPSYTASHISGYMTPNNPIYDTIQSRGSERRQRCYSDTSQASYINPNFKHFVFRRNFPSTENYISENDSVPPPLPPFHPKMSIYRPDSET